MRDIVYAKVTPENESLRPIRQQEKEVPASTIPLPPPHKKAWHEVMLTRLNEAGGYVQHRYNNLLPEGYLRSMQETKASRPPKKKLSATVATKKVKQTGTTIKKGLSTTHGKLLVAHSTALIVLAVFSYRLYSQHTSLQAQAGDSQTSTRRYLPVVPDATTTPSIATSDGIPATSLPIFTWVAPWSATSSAPNTYAGVSAFWLTVSGDGSTFQTKADWQKWDDYRSNQLTGTQKVYLSVSGDPSIVYNAISNPTIQQIHIRTLLDLVKTHNFDGVDIDYEGLGSTNKDAFTSFIQTLSAAFHAEKKSVAVTLEARIGNQVPMDWRAVGAAADEVRIMAYDYHSSTTNMPGPIAPLAWVKEVTTYATSVVDPHKVIIGLGNYGYDWEKNSDGSWTGIGISQERAAALATEQQAPVLRMTGIDDRGYDIGNIPSFTYTDTSGNSHAVWYEDAQSLKDKIQVVSQYPVNGVIFWSVGLGDPTFWTSQTTSQGNN